ncbi:MAG TPA: hypothetical protein VHX14_16855 [Thermoanaerobaculia bacterium]|jgi:hypothetical protein|nr:hypothetical protein [Thermoanaerobaculia bacterium]
MLRFPILLSLAVLLAPFAAAETIRFDPPNVTAGHSVDATVSGVWHNGCLPAAKGFVVDGSTITLHLDATAPLGVLCSQNTPPYSRSWHLGVLPAGGYTVIAVADAGSTSTELTRAPLIVRDAETLTISPYAVPTSGGPIALGNPFFLASATLTIGGVTVPANSELDGVLFAIAPPHAPGVVDVEVKADLCTLTCATVSSKAALIYYDPSDADPAVFEPVLFPLSFQGAGAFGSQWTTESFLYSNGPAAYFRDPLPCAGCTSTFTLGTKQLTNDGNPWGHVLYAMRGTTDALQFASRIRDTSRQALTAGTEVPVARERDFRPLLRFMNIPVDPKYRVTLRLWALGDYPQYIFAIDSVPALQNSLPLTRIPGTSMWFGSADVTATIQQAAGNPANLLVTPPPFGPNNPVVAPPVWGILSITNNDTQQVTIVSPQ